MNVQITTEEFQKLLKLRYKLESYFEYKNNEHFSSIAIEILEELKEVLTELKKFE